jgi:hypothetical protein
MRLYTKEECEEWLRDRKRTKPDDDHENVVERFPYPKEPHRIWVIAHWIATHLTYRMPTLLWLTEWGIWSSSENWYLYYKLRQTHGDLRLLHEAPGHLFLEHESEDLASFLQIAMLNGWGGYILPHPNYVNAFFSHDEYIDFFDKQENHLAEIRMELFHEEKAAP